ncbi:hypothetical protein Bca101_026311 [Brassica carinata]
MVILLGSKGVWRGLANLIQQGALIQEQISSGCNFMVSRAWRLEEKKKGGVF